MREIPRRQLSVWSRPSKISSDRKQSERIMNEKLMESLPLLIPAVIFIPLMVSEMIGMIHDDKIRKAYKEREISLKKLDRLRGGW